MRLKNTALQPNVFTNWNEKGFIIGMVAVTKRIMSKKAYESGRINGASQGGIESLSVYLLVCQLLESLSPPALLYKGESGDLQDGWRQDLQAGERAYFGTQEKMDKVLGLL